MHRRSKIMVKLAFLAVAALAMGQNCASVPAPLGTPTAGTGGGNTGGTGGGLEPGGGGSAGGVPPYTYITIRNTTFQHVEYFLHLFAFAGPGGTVTSDVEPDYINSGYIDVGTEFTFGSIDVVAPAGQRILWYFHNQNFDTTLLPATAIPGGQAPNNVIPTYDNVFGLVPAAVLTPDLILFYNGDLESDPCSIRCARTTDASGAFALEWFSPLQVQGTGCNCFGLSDPFQRLAPPSRPADAALCNEYVQASTITYEFRNQSTNAQNRVRIAWEVTRAGVTVQALAPTN